MTQSFDLAQWYITVLTGHPDTVCDFRCIHDTNKAVAAHTMRGSIRELFPKLQEYNQGGWGIFVCINAMDGNGRELVNVQHIRTHVVDLDNTLTSAASYEQAIKTHPAPQMAVQSSPGKYHLYWLVQPYVGNEFYTMHQRKLAQIYDGDKSIIDPTRVLRVPGFYHLKKEPFLTNCWLINNAPRWTSQDIADSLAHVNVINHIGLRTPLGDPEMAAPSLHWLRSALFLLNPNNLDRQEWLSITAAFKQAGWTLADEQTLLAAWEEWCAQYEKNDQGENLKMWHSIRETEVGWAAFLRRTPIKAYIDFGSNPPVMGQQQQPVAQSNNIPPMPSQQPQTPSDFGEILSETDCKEWFKDCYFIARTGEIFSPRGRYMNSTQFNGFYGGKHFIITQQGKTTDEPWKAALRSTKYVIPKVDHIRFLPDRPLFEIIEDEMGRPGINTYIPIRIKEQPGDITRWLEHMKLMIPHDGDREIFIKYMAHCVKFPGEKIAWAPMLQSVEGTGKGMIYEIMKRSLGAMYVYTPKAQELVTSGSKFNAWMRGKLCIVVNEIKVDERRELIEILKPMITDKQIEVQAKGVDQEMEDNLANWIFFSNFKDAIPISQNGRRYAIFYSAIQTQQDKVKLGIDKTQPYFKSLFHWLEQEGGYEMITYYLRHYPIKVGDCGIEAPETSSYAEALRISRSPMQIIIEEAIQDSVQGFRGGYVSSIAVTKRAMGTGMKAPSNHSIRTVLESMGYHELGRAVQSYPFEDITGRAILYVNDSSLRLEGYGQAQGY